MNPIFQEFLSPSRTCSYQPVSKVKGTISREQAKEDLHTLRYLMENRYCGWDYYENGKTALSVSKPFWKRKMRFTSLTSAARFTKLLMKALWTIIWLFALL